MSVALMPTAQTTTTRASTWRTVGPFSSQRMWARCWVNRDLLVPFDERKRGGDLTGMDGRGLTGRAREASRLQNPRAVQSPPPSGAHGLRPRHGRAPPAPSGTSEAAPAAQTGRRLGNNCY
jgi:hypothetical protein